KVLVCDYTAAEGLADRFMREHPGHPAGPLFKAAVLQYAAVDYEDYSREEEFMSLIGRCASSARNLIDSGNGLWFRYYEAAADGLEGAWKVSSGNFLRGVLNGRSGAGGMRRIVEADSTFYDAYLMLGSYRFWKNVALSKLPIIDLGKRRGINEVRLAIERGSLSGPLANTVLIEMLLAIDPAEAVELGERLRASHPYCRLFLWQLGEGYKKLGRFGEAERVFTAIAESMALDDFDDGSGRLRCWWKLAVLAHSRGDRDSCKVYCKKVVAYENDPVVARRQERRLRAARRMIDEMGENGG
ncbi:MAG: hypothetical protein J7M24_04340, partial [Candidatus Latescibacteria bacterium]|nr:hypothetical protein [Candidatus Latescibacterota bacterium]